MERYKLFLYLATPDHPEMLENIQTLQGFLTQELAQGYDLDVINVLKNPERALKEGVMVTPMLMRGAPPPPLRIVGDFTNRDKVLAALELTPLC